LITTAWDRCGTLNQTTSTSLHPATDNILYQPDRGSITLASHGPFGMEPSIPGRGDDLNYSAIAGFSSAMSQPVTSYNTASSSRYLKASTITEKSLFYDSPYTNEFVRRWIASPKTASPLMAFVQDVAADTSNFEEFENGLFGITPQMGSFNPIFYLAALINSQELSVSMSFYCKLQINCVFRGAKGGGTFVTTGASANPQMIPASAASFNPVEDVASNPMESEEFLADQASMMGDSRPVPLIRNRTDRVPTAISRGLVSHVADGAANLAQRFSEGYTRLRSNPAGRRLINAFVDPSVSAVTDVITNGPPLDDSDI